ncbi:hypothetical protein PFISCL1PPCAC_7127, partial [Pristionchus fissidentatus]
RNQKVAQIREAIKALPADKQEKANEFVKFQVDKEQEMIHIAKSMISKFSTDAQVLLNNVVSAYENGNDIPTKQLNENIKNIINAASDAVKAEFKADESSQADKVKEFAKNMIREASA